MKVGRVSLKWSGMTGVVPVAWGKDRQTMHMHTPHHEEHHEIKHADDGGKAAIDRDDSLKHKKA